MKKLHAVGVIVLFLGVAFSPSINANIKQITTPAKSGNTLYVGGSGEGNYTKIQDSIDLADDKISNKFIPQKISIDNQTLGPNPYAIIETSMGTIKIELFKDLAPNTVNNFINLSNISFYDGLVFHRVIDDFVIQGGGFYPNGTHSESPFGPIDLEIHPKARHVDGAIGMARTSDPNSATSQFYICDGPQHYLDDNYAVFGRVTFGTMSVVRDIAEVETTTRYGMQDWPVDDIIINSLTIKTKSSTIAKASPLFAVRSSRAINEESKEFTCDYVGKGEEIVLSIPKRDDRTESLQKFIDIIGKMDDKTFNIFVRLVINRIISGNYAEEGKIPELKHALHQFKDNLVVLKFEYEDNEKSFTMSPLTGCSTCKCSLPTKFQCLLFYLIQFSVSLYFRLVVYIKDILEFFTLGKPC